MLYLWPVFASALTCHKLAGMLDVPEKHISDFGKQKIKCRIKTRLKIYINKMKCKKHSNIQTLFQFQSISLNNVGMIHQLGAAIFKGHILQNRGSYWGSLLNPIIFQKPKTTWMLLIDTCIYRMNIHTHNKQYHPGAINKLF